jgi:hypothetical protein
MNKLTASPKLYCATKKGLKTNHQLEVEQRLGTKAYRVRQIQETEQQQELREYIKYEGANGND